MAPFGRSPGIAAAVVMASFCLGAVTPAVAQKQETHRVTANGPTVLLSDWTCWHSDCSFANCDARMVRKPSQGTIQVRIRDTTIPRQGRQCAGRPTKGLNLTYEPRAGARGADEVIFRITADNSGNYLKRYLITLP